MKEYTKKNGAIFKEKLKEKKNEDISGKLNKNKRK